MSLLPSKSSIVHLDADAFFAAVEQARTLNCAANPSRWAAKSAASSLRLPMKRAKFGVYTPMPTARARKLCPKLIVLPGDFERYEQFSHWMFGYCYDFTPDVEQTSIDEGYFDLSGTRKPPAEIALTIRKAIGQRLKITVSEGIGTNKLVSAVASKLTKPAAFNEVPPGREAAFPASSGQQMAARHRAKNQRSPQRGRPGGNPARGGDAAFHAGTFAGQPGRHIRQFANGIDERPLCSGARAAKVLWPAGNFCGRSDRRGIRRSGLAADGGQSFAKVREEGRSIRTLTVKVRYNDMAEDQASESLLEPTDLETDVYGLLHTLLRKAWKRRVSLRLVSLKLSNVFMAGPF
jgi:nucleotidyltransferase/DNA polymerase involved in DNA repair